MICPQCGQQNEDGSRFCGNCGADLSAASAATSEQFAQQSYTPDYSSQPAYQEANTYTQASSPYDTGMSQPTQADYSQNQGYTQPQQQVYNQPQPTPAQYNVGYNQPVQQPNKKFPVLPVVLAVVAVIAAVGGFLFMRGNSGGNSQLSVGGNSGGGTPTITSSGVDLSERYSNSSHGWSFQAPSGGTTRDTDNYDVYITWSSPSDLWVMVGVGEGFSVTVDEYSEYLREDFDATIVDSGSDYLVAVSTDSDGDTNYTKVIFANGNLYLMDIYYHPADESTMYPIVEGIMNSFTV